MSLAASLARRMLRLSGLLTAARVAAAGLTFVFQALLARWMGADGLGVYVLATSLASVLAIFTTMGFGAVTSRFLAAYRAEGREDLIAGFRHSSYRHLAAASLVFVGASAAAILLVPGLVSAELRQPLALGALAAPVLGLIRINGAYANVNRRFLLGFLPDILARPALQIGLLLLLVLLTPVADPVKAVWIFVTAALFAALGQALAVRRLIPRPVADPPVFETALWRRAGLPMAVSVLLMTYLAEVDVLILSLLIDEEAIAVFSICVRLIAFVGFAIYAVYQVMLPDLSEAWAMRDRRLIEAAVRRANLICVAGSLLALAGAAALGPLALGVFGPEFAPGYRALLIVAAAQAFVAATGPGAQVLMVAGEQNRCLVAYGAGLALIAALNCWLAPALPIDGAAYAFAAGLCLSALLLWLFARLRLGLDVSLLAFFTRVPEPERTVYNPPQGPRSSAG